MRLQPTKSDLDRLAGDAWTWLKCAAHLPEDGWRIADLARRDDAATGTVSRLVAHADLGKFTFKFQLRPKNADQFARHYRIQQEAYHAFPHNNEFTMPEPVFVDADRHVSLLRYVEGRPVSEAVKTSRNPSEQLALLTKCGAWLDVFHRCQTHDDRPFRPAHTLRRYQKIRDEIQSGERHVVAKQLYLRGVERLVELAPDVKGRQTAGARQHGDFHLRNLILHHDQIAGIDITKDHVAPVGFDIAKILLDFTSVFRSADGLRNGEVVHDDTLSAFFDGYRLVQADDPGVAFLLNARILATLNSIPHKRTERSTAKQRTLNRLRPIAENAFRFKG